MPKNKKSTPNSEIQIGAVGHSTYEQKMFMINWLEDDERNLALVTGKAAKTMGHGNGIPKIKVCFL